MTDRVVFLCEHLEFEICGSDYNNEFYYHDGEFGHYSEINLKLSQKTKIKKKIKANTHARKNIFKQMPSFRTILFY